MTHKGKGQSVSHLLHEERKFFPPKSLSQHAYIKSLEKYETLYRRSIEESALFWLEQADGLSCFRKPKIVCRYRGDSAARHIEHTWFEDGQINVSVNCLDRHLQSRHSKTAILWQGDRDS